MMRVKAIGFIFVLLILQRSVTIGQLPQLTIQTGHTDEVTNLEFSDDGKYLASAGKDNVIIVWDFNLGKQIKRLKGHTGAVNCMRFFNSGNMLATCGDDGKILIWDLNSESVIKSMPQVKSAKIVSLDVSPDGTLIYFCGNPFYFSRWDLKTNEITDLRTEFTGSRVYNKFNSDFSDYINVSLSEDGNRIMVGKNGGIYLFNKSFPKSDKLYRDERRIIIDSLMNTSKVKKSFVKRKMGHVLWLWTDNKLQELVYSEVIVKPKKKRSSGMVKPEVIKWNCAGNKSEFIRSSDFSKYKFTSGSVNADHTLIAAGNEDNNIYLWDFVTGEENRSIIGQSIVSAVAFHPQKKNILVSCDAGRDIYVWDLTEGKILRKFSSTTFPITAIAVNDAENIITMAGSDNSIRILNLKENVDLRSIDDNKSNICGLGFTPSGNGIVSVGLDNRIKFWNLDADKLNLTLKGNANTALFNAVLHLPVLALFTNTFTTYFFTKSFILNNPETLKAMDISSGNRYTAAGGTGYRSGYFYRILAPRLLPIHIIDNQSQKIDLKLPGHYISVDALSFNSGGNLLASAGHDYKMSGKSSSGADKKLSFLNLSLKLTKSYTEINSLKVWDMNGRTLSSAFENKSPIRSIAFERKSDSLVFADEDKNIVILDYKKNSALNLQKGTGPLLFFNNDKRFLFQDQAYSMKIFDLSADSVIRQFKGHSDKISSAVLIQNDKRLITAGWDGTLRLWDVEKGTEIVTFYAINKSDFLIKTPDNYYYATKNAVSEIGFTFGMKFYPFEQFDLKYNRPDIVLKQLGNTSPDLLAAYTRAYEKRIKKLGFTEDMLSEDFHVPEVEITNIESIDQITDKKSITLQLKSVDSKYKLDRINIWINDVALYGKDGIDKRTANALTSSDEIKIQLAAGINKIQVSALNQAGAESLKEIIEVNCNAPVIKPDLYLISIGISKYSDPRFNLNYASKDASDISQLFRGDTSLYKHVYIKTLTDEQVTASKLNDLRAFFEGAGRDDVVMLFVAGHGLLDANLDYYFGTYDMDFNNPAGKGIIYDDIESLFDGLNSLKKILFMDTCFSGEVDKDEMELAQNTSTEFGDVTFRAAGAGVRMKEAFGMNNTSELMKELFTDIRKGTGSTVISSAGGAEFAMEGDQWKNGLFTFCVLNGINKKAADTNKDGIIMLSELQDYVRTNVSNLSNGKQSPTSRIQNISMDFRVW
jgi:WD40 repeat protein